MPPVFGPSSPSRRRLWSWLVASGSTCVPSLMTMKLASSPCRNSSTTTRAPASPRLLRVIIWSIAPCASATLAATTTPFPAARPSALTTIGAPRLVTKAFASSALSKVLCSAVGILCRAMKLLAKSLDASSCAAARLGPKIFRPASRNASTTPAASGASGPTTVSRIFSFLAKAMSSAVPVMATLSTPFSVAVPPLPGATNTFCTRGLCVSFHASACSRPPPPMTRSFISACSCASMPEVSHPGEHHRDATLIGRRDDLGVLHAAAGLDHRRGTGRGKRIETVAEGEECVGRRHRAREVELRLLRLEHRDACAVEAAHLAGADAEGGAVAHEDDGVGLDELGDAPGEQKVLHLLRRRLLLGGDLEVGFLQDLRVGALNQQAPADALVLMRLRLVRERHFQHAHVCFAGEYLLRIGLDARRDDHLGKLLANGFGGGAVERTVEGEDAAESGHRVGREGARVSFAQVGAGRDPAGVGMLDDDARRLAEALHAFPRRVGVGDVVVRELLALHLLVAREGAGHRLGIAVERRGLVRVLAVAQL